MVLRKALTRPYSCKTHSDCEIIIHLYNETEDKLLNQLEGIFTFVLYDVKANRLIAARGPIGVTTLSYGDSSKTPETIYFSSEMKALNEDCDRILCFPPGHMFHSVTAQINRW